MLWLPIPGFPNYEASTEGTIRNVLTGRVLKHRPVTSRGKRRNTLHLIRADGKRKHCIKARMVLSAKLGRELHPHEQARHIDGDSWNDAMSNLIAGCAINNTIDNVVRGTFLTTIEQIDIAIERLTDLKYLLNYNDYQRKESN